MLLALQHIYIQGFLELGYLDWWPRLVGSSIVDYLDDDTDGVVLPVDLAQIKAITELNLYFFFSSLVGWELISWYLFGMFRPGKFIQRCFGSIRSKQRRPDIEDLFQRDDGAIRTNPIRRVKQYLKEDFEKRYGKEDVEHRWKVAEHVKFFVREHFDRLDVGRVQEVLRKFLEESRRKSKDSREGYLIASSGRNKTIFPASGPRTLPGR